MRYTPENIEELKPGERFVFGSNEAGIHSGGAARIAADRFGAMLGVGEGLTGKCYAFPTLDKNFQKRSMEDLMKSRDDFFDTVKVMPNHTFLLTKVGCGIAGFQVEAMAELFRNHPENVVIPKEFSII